MRIHAKKLLTPQGFVSDQIVTIENGMIAAIEPGTDAPLFAQILTPGLIDLHVHGGEGFDARNFGLDVIEPFLSRMLASGVTGLLATVSTGQRDTMRHGLEITRQAMRLQQEGRLGGARILGAHLEGPFLSQQRPGAMPPEDIVPPSVAAYEHLFAGYEDVIRKISIAVEEPGADELIAHLQKKGVIVQAGHTDATFEQAQHAFALGVRSLCHTFNACRPIHHRSPGIITAALLDPNVYCEAICDLEHLHGGALQLIYRMKGADRMILISDSVATHGLQDGEYFMEGYHIVVKNGISRTASGALDGGGAYLDQAVRNLMTLGASEEDAVNMASRTPAARMGFDTLGEIAPGKRAHLTAWDENWHVVFTILEDGVHAGGH